MKFSKYKIFATFDNICRNFVSLFEPHNGMVTCEIFGKKAVETINSTGKTHRSLAESACRLLVSCVPTITAPFFITSASLPATSLFLYSTCVVLSYKGYVIFRIFWAKIKKVKKNIFTTYL